MVKQNMTPQEIISEITKGNRKEAEKLWYEAQDMRLGALIGKTCMKPFIIQDYIEKHNPKFVLTYEMIKVLTPIEDIRNEFKYLN